MKKRNYLLGIAAILNSAVAFGSTDPFDKINSVAGTFMNYVQVAGLIVGIFMLVFAGFKFLTSGAGKKAEAKEQIVPLIIGAAIIILAPAIFKMIWTAFGGQTTLGSGGNLI